MSDEKKNIYIYIYQQFVDEVFFQGVAHNHQPTTVLFLILNTRAL